jgi:hypothetical protein
MIRRRLRPPASVLIAIALAIGPVAVAGASPAVGAHHHHHGHCHRHHYRKHCHPRRHHHPHRPKSRVRVRLQTSITRPTPQTTLTVIALLRPHRAYGRVALFDNGHRLGGAHRYRLRWSYTTTSMTVGSHQLVVRFRPAPASGFRLSHASVRYLVHRR